MTNPDVISAADFLGVTTEYDTLRRQTVATKLGPTIMAQASEQMDILDSALANLTGEEFGSYLDTLSDEEPTDSESAIDQVNFAKSEFDEAALHKMNLSPVLNTASPISFSVIPGRLGVVWIDPSKSIPEEMANHLVAVADDEGVLTIKRRAQQKDLPARIGDDLLVKWLIDEVASATNEIRNA